LGVPAPSTPFPRANDRASMGEQIDKVRKIGWAIILGTPALVAAAGYGFLCFSGLI